MGGSEGGREDILGNHCGLRNRLMHADHFSEGTSFYGLLSDAYLVK